MIGVNWPIIFQSLFLFLGVILFVFTLFPGFGKGVVFGFGFVLTLILFFLQSSSWILVIIVWVSLIFLSTIRRFGQERYIGSEVIFEGGGIRRGLSATEYAQIYGLDGQKIFIIALIELLEKGFVKIEGGKLTDIRIEVIERMKVEDFTLNPHKRTCYRREAAMSLNQYFMVMRMHYFSCLKKTMVGI